MRTLPTPGDAELNGYDLMLRIQAAAQRDDWRRFTGALTAILRTS